jgi:putative oxidoreductase
MRTKATHGARIVLGLIFFVFGLNGFLHFIPQPPMSGPPEEFLGALIATGYLFPLLKTTEVVTGALLLSGRLVPLALVVLAPVIVNIFAFHLFLAPAGLALPLLVVALEIFLARSYWGAFAGLMRARVAPAGAKEEPAGLAASATRHGDVSRTDMQDSEVRS